jgi:hypothetical protein
MDAGRRIARKARTSRVEADFVKIAVLPIRIPQRPLPRIRPGEDRYLATAVIVEP